MPQPGPGSAFTGPDYIDPVPPTKLSEAKADKRMDDSSARLRKEEWGYIKARRKRAGIPGSERDEPADDLAGLAFSGGGIRSATFSLGVLQALAEADSLKRFDYLSTVSGGGYIGSSLTWLTSTVARERVKERASKEPAGSTTASAAPPTWNFGVGRSGSAAPLPYGTADPRTETEVLPTPPERAVLRYLRQHGNYLIPGEGITLTSGIVVLLRGMLLNLLVWVPLVAALMLLLIMFSPRFVTLGRTLGDVPVLFLGILIAASILLLLLVIFFVCYSLYTYRARSRRSAKRYTLRRMTERLARVPLWIAGGFLLVGSVPLVAGGITGWITGPSFTLAGLITGLATFIRSTRPVPSAEDGNPAKKGGIGGWMAPVGAALLLYGIPILSYDIALAVYNAFGKNSVWIMVALFALGGLTGYFVNLNYITIHRFYRDRLMEAFLPDIDRAIANKTGPAADADSVRLSEMCDRNCPVGPYHIINTNLVVTHSDERMLRLRGGDSFILSPLYCGSNATGWRPTGRYMGNVITLPSAMAVSGAAANPWAGSGGTGVTRNLMVSTLMALTNLRLGYWARNPCTKEWEKDYRPNHFAPGLREVIGASLKETSSIALLSDGGHFENLALYELIRRRVRLIVVCDGGADPDYEFSDLHVAMARVRDDFGARIEFDAEGLAPFMPSIEAPYPARARLSKRAYAIARITYSDSSTGRLIYFTTALTEGLRLQLMGYKGANWDFTDQSTGDQFFDETQFEAYRELGYSIAEDFIGKNPGWMTLP